MRSAGPPSRRPAAAAPALLLLLGLALPACRVPAFREHRAPAPAAFAGVERHLPMPAPRDPALAQLEAVPLLRLRGAGYERGWQYGRAMADGWRLAVRRLGRHAAARVAEEVPVGALAGPLVEVGVAHVVGQLTGGDPVEARRRFPPEYRAYVRGIADGAGVHAREVMGLVALVMLSDASCSAFVACGPATEDGRLLQMRSLDWGADELEAARQTVLLVHEPPGRLRYLSIGVVGLVGTVSGVNEAGVALSEIGAESADRTWRGMPMPILLEEVLARAATLDEAVRLLVEAPGTGGYVYMVGSAAERRGAVVEKTARRAAVFEVGQSAYADSPFFAALPGFDCRADTAADPEIRRWQRCSRGPDGTPRGSNAYEARYRRQVELFEGFGRVLDLERAAAIQAAVAAPSNLHSVLYDASRGRVYLRNRAWFADGHPPADRAERERLRAGVQPALAIDLAEVFPR